MKTTPTSEIFPNGLSKILLDIPMEKADRELLENVYFYPPLAYSFWAMAICSETCRDTSKSPVPL